MIHVGTLFIRAMVGLFLLGLGGSAIVVLISFFEDFKELFSKDEPATETHGGTHQ